MVQNIIETIDKLAVSFHTLETKKESIQWVKKGQQSPNATRLMEMMLIFFEVKSIIHMNYSTSQGQNRQYQIREESPG
jgi:hypothetical protein